MAQPSNTDLPTDSDAPTREEEQPEPLKFKLVVVSPSVGVESPLSFPQVPATASVKDLKARIRDALPAKPANENQRLIHRGRMLARETETMEEIFGKETLANPESQTLHLVLRPSGTDLAPQTAPTPTTSSQVMPTPLQPQPHLQPRPQSTSGLPRLPLPGQQNLPGIQHVHQHQLLHQADALHHSMTQRLRDLNAEVVRLQQEMHNIDFHRRFPQAIPGAHNMMPPPEFLQQQPALNNNWMTTGLNPTVQQLIQQQQRERASLGQQGLQDSGASASGRASPNAFHPEQSTSTTREGVGPNGERWQITVNQTTTTIPMRAGQYNQATPQFAMPIVGTRAAQTPGATHYQDVQNILRNADRQFAAQPLTNSLERSNSAPETTITTANGVAGAGAQPQTHIHSDSSPGAATPATTSSSPSSSVLLNPPTNPTDSSSAPIFRAHITNTSNTTPGPEVYLLSSPQGPRAILLSEGGTFFTPRQPRRRHLPSGAHDRRGAGLRRQAGAQNAPNNAAAADAPLNPFPHGNPPAAAVGARLGQMLWLVVRLAGFVWFFAGGNTGWWRFLMVSGLAVGLFIINTGILNGVADQLWGPIRRHVENLIPLAGPDAARVPARNAVIPPQPAVPAGDDQPHRRRRHGELDEHEVAARLLQQQREANAGWLMTQIRRMEHSALLFLASFVPGVGERHIAAREAEAVEAEAERRRREEAATEAANADTVNVAANPGESQEQDGQDTARPGSAPVEAPPAVVT